MTSPQRHELSLPARFELDREIGRGGMAVVYRAHDNHLGRYVAIKVLSSDLSNTVTAERFQREIAMMAKLVHPGIVALFDSGVADGRLFYVMPFVVGETLRARVTREQRLMPQDAASLGADIAEALAYAHGSGIVHRDVKPENVFTVGGRAVLADFGIARIIDASPDAQRSLTTGGMVVGTLAYMSPEQGLGEPDLDGRSDLYSLGCVLYELLCGVPPFLGSSALAVLGKHVSETPQHIGERGTEANAALQSIVMQLLAKAPADRPRNAADVARALRATLQVVAAERAPLPHTSAQENEIVAVTELEYPVGDAECAPIASAVTNAVASSLAGMHAVRVQLGTTSRTDLAVQGSVRRAGRRLRVSMRVVASDAALLWSEHVDGTLDDVFTLEDSVSERVNTWFQTRAKTSTRAPGTSTGSTVQSEAEQMVSKATKALNQFGPSGGAASRGYLEEARAYLTRALELEPRNARALCTMGNLASVEGATGILPRDEAAAISRRFTYAALAANDQVAEVHTSMAKIALYIDDDVHLALRHSRRAVDLDPHDPESQRLLSVCCKIFGRNEDAIDAARAATTLSPDTAGFWNTLGDALLAAGRNSEAIDVLKRATALLPNYSLALERLERAHLAHGETELGIELRAARMRIAKQRDRAELLEAERVTIGAAAAIRNDFQRELDVLLNEAQHADPFAEMYRRSLGDRIAAGYAELGDWPRAMDWIERGFERRPGRLRRMLADLPVDFRGLAVDPRYTRLMRIAGLEDLI